VKNSVKSNAVPMGLWITLIFITTIIPHLRCWKKSRRLVIMVE